MFKRQNTQSGLTLVEAVIVIGLTVLIFSALFVGFEFALKFIAQSRAKMSALSLATDRTEYIRSLPYDSVGTVSGIPNGSIPQNRTVALNGINFAERVLVEYVDDPSDGVAGADTNGVVSDYKRFKVEYTWTVYGEARSFSLISTVTPRSIETTSGGGTIRVNVTDAGAVPMSGASVRLLNTSGTTTIDVTRTTDVSGQALFTGAPAGSNYQVFVYRTGYSEDQTREATTTLPFPVSQPFSLLEADVSTVNFQIDELSDLAIKIYSSETTVDITEEFNDWTNVYSTSSVAIASGVLSLFDTLGVYDVLGTVMLSPITPSPIEAWGLVSILKTVPAGTDVKVRFYSSTSTASLISESNLPGNLAGFTDEFINLGGLDLSTYPTLVVGLELSTTDASLTPAVNSINVAYADARTMLGNEDFNMVGGKVIGANALAQSVYKFSLSTSTDALGELNLQGIEWDDYQITFVGSYDVAEACPALPFGLEPDTDESLTIWAVNGGSHNLRVHTKSTGGSPVIGATVSLDDNAGSIITKQTGACGQAFFPSLSSAVEYTLEVSANGFSNYTISSTTVAGTAVEEVILTP
jgi:hypothetical protein